MIKAEGSLRGYPLKDLENAKKEANGYLLSRSAVKLVEIVARTDGTPPAGWPVVMRATRKTRGGPITFTEIAF
jgi:hypothetical protein